MNKVYAVVEYGGAFDTAWQRIAAVCSSKEVAEKIRLELIQNHTSKDCNISYEEWEEMVQDVMERELDTGLEFRTLIDGLLFVHPNTYTREDFELADNIYNNFDDFVGAFIEETNFINGTNY